VVTFATKKSTRKKGKILITSALPYVNNVPHLGNIIGCVLSADVFSRYCKLKRCDSLFVCGTDEHGTATETKALEEGIMPKELCDKYYAIHKRIYDWFNINFDIFGRTSTPEHESIVQDIFQKLYKNKCIKEATVEQLFCSSCSKFLADRFVEGECPNCHAKGARGDQCDSCSHLLNAVELLDPHCKVCGKTPEIRESEHLFLDLEKLQPALTRWVEKQKSAGFWTDNAITTTEKWLKEGLKPRAISRDLKWGVQIPLEKYKEKVFYVWFDAPIGYISITAKAREDWKEWWTGKDVKLYQFMAKDNIPFHTILFPATLLGTKEKWTMLHHINSTEYLNYEDAKFSKSRGSGVFGDDVIETGIPSDVWRYYLLINRPETSDTVFSWKDFQDKLNNELVANLGNLVNRTTTFITRFYDGKVYPLTKEELDTKDAIKRIEDHLEKVEIKRALHEVMALSRIGNKYFQDNEPWKLIKEDPDKAKNVLANLFSLVRDLSIVLWPFLPTTAESIWKQLNLPQQYWSEIGWKTTATTINAPALLFAKAEDSRIQELKERYKGTQEQRGAGDKQEDAQKGRTEGDSDAFQTLGLRVAEIIEAQPHPSADKLYVLKIDIGEERPRTLVAGIRPYYAVEELLHKKIIVVSNLEPAVLRGIESEGMLLAAGETVGLLTVKESENGSPVFYGSDNKGINPSKHVSYKEFTKLSITAKDGKAYFLDKLLRTEKEEIIVEKGAEGRVK
jgi:methionyl-tRNA synthetase